MKVLNIYSNFHVFICVLCYIYASLDLHIEISGMLQEVYPTGRRLAQEENAPNKDFDHCNGKTTYD